MWHWAGFCRVSYILILMTGVSAWAEDQTPPTTPPGDQQPTDTSNQIQPVLTASFDDQPTAMIRGESMNPQVVGPVAYVDGQDGKAVVVGVNPAEKPEHQTLRYKLTQENVLNWSRGTVSFRACPQDWNGADADFHVLFEAAGDGGRMLIYKYENTSQLYFLLGPDAKDINGKWRWSIATASIKDWQQGQWRQITCTWNAQSVMKIYIDGQSKGLVTLKEIPAKPCTLFAVGGNYPAGWNHPQGKTAIDQLKIWNRTLMAEQVAQLLSNTNTSPALQN